MMGIMGRARICSGVVEESVGNGGDSMGMGKGGLGNTVHNWAEVDMH